MRIGVPKETAAGEKRVATVPDVVEKLIKLGFTVAVESGAGDAANFADDTYRAAGAEVLPTAAELWAKSDIVFKVRPGRPFTAGRSESMPLFVFSPVTMAVMPAAESVTHRSSDEVSDNARCGKLCR